MCGSGTTIDVCKEESRRVIGYDISPVRPDIIQNDARKILLEDNSVDMVFIDSPYGENIKYSNHPNCIGKIPCEDERFLEELEKVINESYRILKPGKVFRMGHFRYVEKKKVHPSRLQIIPNTR
ncbi:MAG: methyltransferase domain-containing protein [Methanophagales archaeon]|nr:methyltransferase domain-containing protein [Methanophagales archaeon]